jgi:hypothetical protein
VNTVILNWQRSLWEGDWEVVKKSGRDEPMWVAIYICMETTQGISLYGFLHLELAKMLCFCFYLVGFFFNKIGEKRAEQVLPGGTVVGGNNVYTCK